MSILSETAITTWDTFGAQHFVHGWLKVYFRPSALTSSKIFSKKVKTIFDFVTLAFYYLRQSRDIMKLMIQFK